MLFQVEMQVHVPADMDPARFEGLKVEEKARCQILMQAGIWRHLWRVVGQYKNLSIFEVPNNAALHELLSSLPLFPFMELEVTALCRHPSSIRDDES
ncbi:MAG: muconolactone Delta-isomerase family protein [Caulobacteraceae bacterium]